MPVLQKNQTITLEINGYTAEGAGVGHFEGMAVFVPGTLKGETVQCHIIKCAKRYAVGKLRNILASSPHRTTPPCPHFARCGGCALQHIDAAEQLAFKQQRIADAFSRIGGLPSFLSLFWAWQSRCATGTKPPSPLGGRLHRHRSVCTLPEAIASSRWRIAFFSRRIQKKS